MSRAGLGLLLLFLCGCAAVSLRDRAPQGSRHAGSPAELRDAGWIQFSLGKPEAGEEALRQAESLGLRDARTLLGLALRAHDTAQVALARQGWLRLLESVRAADPWAPAAAEMAAHRLLALVSEPPGSAAEERDHLERVLRLWRRSSHLPIEARQLLAALAAQLLRLARREAEAEAVDAARGCPQVLFSTGPHGHLPRVDLMRHFAPDDPARDPSRIRYVRHQVRGCELTLQGPLGRRGVVYAVAWTWFPGGALPLTVETGNETWALSVDGVIRYVDTEPERRRMLWIRAPRGWHALAFKVSMPWGRARLQLSLPGARFFDGPPERAPAASTGPVQVWPRELSALPRPRQRAEVITHALLQTQQAYIRGAIEAGLSAAERAGAPGLSSLRLLEAALLAEDSSRPARIVRDQIRRLLGATLEADPALLRARIQLARLEHDDDHDELALEILDARPASQQRAWQALLLRHHILRSRGWTLEAEQALDEALALAPSACETWEARIEARRDIKDERGALQAARQLAACNPYTERYAEELRAAGRLVEARAEYERLLRLRPDDEALLVSLVEVLVARRELAAAERCLRRLVGRSPSTPGYRVHLANVLLDQGRSQEAEAVLRAGLADAPASQDLHRALQVLGVPPPMEAYRIDGQEVIQQYHQRRSATAPQDAAVIVLDRTVVRVFPDGTRWTLTHNIVHVLSKDGIDRFGEVRLPEGAEVLTLRTVKADGTTREPEEFADKDSISAPDLEAGDYVEFEYIDREEPAAAFGGGFLAERFYFASVDAALDRTEYLLVTPWEMPLQIDLRGPDPPQAQVERHGDLRHSLWARRGVPRLQLDLPQAEALLAEWVPSVRVASGVTLQGWRDYLRDRWFLSLRANAELRRAAAEAIGPVGPTGIAGVVSQVRRIDAWVRRAIKPGGDMDEAATSILARREGNAHLLTAALLRLAGIPVELWLVRPVTAPRLDGPLPPTELYSEVLLAVAPGQGPDGHPLLWLDPAYRHAPTGLVRPLLRGGTALRIGQLGQSRPPAALLGKVALPEEGGGLVPGLSIPRDGRQIEMTMRLGLDGGGEVQVRERLTGWPALEWREGLDRLSADQFHKEVEQRLLGFFFPGATLEQLRHGPREDDAPLVVEYAFRAPRLARRRMAQGRTELVLPAPFPALLAKRYVGVPTRRSPLQLGYVVPVVLEARVELPRGVGPVRAGPEVRLSTFGRFCQQVVLEGSTLRLHVEFFLPARRVEPAEYDEFVAYARQVDAAEESAAVIPLSP
ncbi:MAG: hypothetical protein RMK29_15930 [Myxococcales bacterium]|nr:hypothetical protein [Myxococcota bacterium]MDW8283206.1 hypothetical protein [Myxococcales bacterium]